MEAKQADIKFKLAWFVRQMNPNFGHIASQLSEDDAMVFVYELNEYAVIEMRYFKMFAQQYPEVCIIFLPSNKGTAAIICDDLTYATFCKIIGKVPNNNKMIAAESRCYELLFAHNVPLGILNLLDFHCEFWRLHPRLKIRELKPWMRSNFPKQKSLTKKQISMCFNDLGFTPSKAEINEATA